MKNAYVSDDMRDYPSSYVKIENNIWIISY